MSSLSGSDNIGDSITTLGVHSIISFTFSDKKGAYLAPYVDASFGSIRCGIEGWNAKRKSSWFYDVIVAWIL